MKSKFKSREDYLEWCHQQVTKIGYAEISMNSKIISDIVLQISRTLHCSEGQVLYDN